MKKTNRSDKYQYLILETSCSNDMLESFSNDDSIHNRLNPFHYDERVLDLEEQLTKELWRLINSSLTPRQISVIQFTAEGKTQVEIAKKLNVNQSSITKSLNGNVDYKKNGTKKTAKSYGGSKRRLLKLAETDEKIQELLKKIQELREEKW